MDNSDLDYVAQRLAELLLQLSQDDQGDEADATDDSDSAEASTDSTDSTDSTAPPNTTFECPCCGGLVEASQALANPVTPVLLGTCPQGNAVLAIPETNYAVCRSGDELIVLDADAVSDIGGSDAPTDSAG